jgi:hypothetical protein
MVAAAVALSASTLKSAEPSWVVRSTRRILTIIRGVLSGWAATGRAVREARDRVFVLLGVALYE